MSSAASIQREIVECWNRRDFDGMRNLCHPEYTYTGGDGKELTGGPEISVTIGRMWAAAFPDAKIEVKQVYTQGDTAITEMIGRGTHSGSFMGTRPTGRRVDVVFCTVIELRDGRVYRERQYLDLYSVLSQIGFGRA